MIVPEYWAEAKERVVIDNKSRTYKRFGWSDVDEDEALENARQRVSEAADQARRGEKVRLVDHKVAYNGSEGLPIREEIIERHNDAVITRNTYGSLCLNTPDVLFADVDIPEKGSSAIGWIIIVPLILIGYWAHLKLDHWLPLGIAVVLGIFLAPLIGRTIDGLATSKGPNPYDVALAKIEAFARDNVSWLLRVYRTPNGFRVLVMHRTFEPDGEEAHRFMQAIDGDPLYARMCRNQNCFRARVSPKPWRVGVEEHIRPRPGIWPIAIERMGDRRSWVQHYEDKAAGFASCRFEKTLGKTRHTAKCEAVRLIHDEKCKSDSNLPIA